MGLLKEIVICLIMTKSAAANGRFYESGGVIPQKHLWKFASASTARTFVNPRLHKAAGTLPASGGQRSGTMKQKIEIKRKSDKNYKFESYV